MTTTRAVPPPPIPPRARTNSEGLVTTSDVPDEPPPAYEAQPNPATQEQTLQYGPSRPFQPVDAVPHLFYPQQQQQQQQHQGPYSPPPPSSLPPPNFPFWNGPNLSHQQTGFMPGPLNPPPPPQQVQPQGGAGAGGTGWAPPPPPHPHSSPPTASTSPAYAPTPTSPPPNSTTTTPNPSTPKNYAPTTIPTAGQPLLRNNHILVYPIGKDSCPKCHNTGYKPFVGTGGDDPNHPCRKCWEKFGRPFTGAIRIAATSTPTPPNYQKPLRLSYRPPTGIQFGGGVYPGTAYQQVQRPGMMQQQGTTTMGNNTYGQPNTSFNPPSRIHVTHQPPIGGGAVVFRPGDPRLGGMRCYRCGGEGTTWGIFFQDETCDLCRGVGRLY